MKMDLRELLLVLSMLWSMSSALRCYKCKPQKDDYGLVQLCEHFDYSDKYISECEHSTMCYKREISSSLGNGLQLYERDCANQIMKGDQERNSDGRWVEVKKIYETVDEGCKAESPNGKVTRTMHCYCRGNLCNGASTGASGGVIMVLIPLFIKYLLQ